MNAKCFNRQQTGHIAWRTDAENQLTKQCAISATLKYRHRADKTGITTYRECGRDITETSRLQYRYRGFSGKVTSVGSTKIDKDILEKTLQRLITEQEKCDMPTQNAAAERHCRDAARRRHCDVSVVPETF